MLVAHHVADPNTGLASSRQVDKFKLYLADTGLMVTLMFKDKRYTDNVIYKQLLGHKLPKNLGLLYENIVAQMLAAKGHQLFYHSYYDATQGRSFEVDFLLSTGNKISPRGE